MSLRKKRGRPPTGIKTVPVMTRIPMSTLKKLKQYKRQTKEASLQSAIRRLIDTAVIHISI